MEKLAITTRGSLEDMYTFGTVVVVDEKNNIGSIISVGE